MTEEKIMIEGIVKSILFHSEENDYTIFRVDLNKSVDMIRDDEIVCMGNIPNLKLGENLLLWGDIIINSKYGMQFKVNKFEVSLPSSKDGIKKYLASGIIKGIGIKTAEKIVDKFGINAIDIMENDPEKLATIKGINIKKAINISKEIKEKEQSRQILIYLETLNIPSSIGSKIYRYYKENTVSIINENPYRLSEEVFGIGFKTADGIAYKIGIPKDSSYRIKACIRYILNENSYSKGNVYIPENILIDEVKEYLELDEILIKNSLQELIFEKQVVAEKTETTNNIFLSYLYYSECYIAKKLLLLSSQNFDTISDDNIQENIQYLEKEDNIILANKQKLAIESAMKNNVLVITGGPGTGKTTTINTIIKLFTMNENTIGLCAPTGRASKRMSEATGMEAQTIHRLLGVEYGNKDSKFQSFARNEELPLEEDIIIVDECSMIDINLMSSLLRAVSLDTKLILVGDVDQLPSVGPGNVLKDIIDSSCVEVVRLDEIFRQASQSAIVTNAHRINKGEFPILNGKENDFFFVTNTDINTIGSTIVELVTKRLPKFIEVEDLMEFQILTPMKKSNIGSIELNNILQEAINPPTPYKNEKVFGKVTFREGDKVMQTKNNYNIKWIIADENEVIENGVGVFNGDEGIILEINNDANYMIIVFDENKFIKYEFSMLEELSLSYAITIHKSQGSEYKAVIIPIHNGPPKLLTRNLLYTGVTRAKELVVLVGIKDKLANMVSNNSEILRYSSLKDRMVKLKDYV